MAHSVFKDHFSPLFFLCKNGKVDKSAFLWVGDAVYVVHLVQLFSTGIKAEVSEEILKWHSHSHSLSAEL